MVDTIYFCGIKHSGKSSLGSLVAQQLHYRWADSDQLILDDRPEYPTIRDFYTNEGKEAFMAQEVASLKTLLALKRGKTLISLGGGACDNAPLCSLIRSSGKVVYLFVAQDILLKRILAGGVPPFLDPLDIEGSFTQLFAHRDALYRTLSDIVIELPPYADLNDSAQFLVSTLSEELLYGS